MCRAVAELKVATFRIKISEFMIYHMINTNWTLQINTLYGILYARSVRYMQSVEWNGGMEHCYSNGMMEWYNKMTLTIVACNVSTYLRM